MHLTVKFLNLESCHGIIKTVSLLLVEINISKIKGGVIDKETYQCIPHHSVFLYLLVEGG